ERSAKTSYEVSKRDLLSLSKLEKPSKQWLHSNTATTTTAGDNDSASVAANTIDDSSNTATTTTAGDNDSASVAANTIDDSSNTDTIITAGDNDSASVAANTINDSSNTDTIITAGDNDSAGVAANTINDSSNTDTIITAGDNDSASVAANTINDSSNTGTTTGHDDSAGAGNDACDAAVDNSRTTIAHSIPHPATLTDSGCQTECPVVLCPDPMVVERMMAELSSLRAAIAEIRQSHKIEVDALHTELKDLRGQLVHTEGGKNASKPSKRSTKVASTHSQTSTTVIPGATDAVKPLSSAPTKCSDSQKQSSGSESCPRDVNRQQIDAKPTERLEPRAGQHNNTDDEWWGLPELQSGTKTLLLGDSVLRGLHQDKMSVTGSDKCQVISISGLDRAGLLKRLRCMEPTDVVTTLVLHIGINDCKRGYLLGKKSWRDIISAARRCFPAAEIYMSSILPMNTEQQTDPCVADSNFCLGEVCISLQAKFIDNDCVFYTRTGEMKSSWYRDAIHPNVRGSSSLAINVKRAFSGRTPPRQIDGHAGDVIGRG
ncbi:hypothetical protein BaRGS_00011242, partial [Batillaria attramentaria]